MYQTRERSELEVNVQTEGENKTLERGRKRLGTLSGEWLPAPPLSRHPKREKQEEREAWDDKTTRHQHQSGSEETRLGNNIKALDKGHQRRRQELEWQQRQSFLCVCRNILTMTCTLCVYVCKCVQVCKILECWQSEHISASLSVQCVDEALADRLVRAATKTRLQTQMVKAEMLEKQNGLLHHV